MHHCMKLMAPLFACLVMAMPGSLYGVTTEETEALLLDMKGKLPFIIVNGFINRREPTDYSEVKDAWRTLLPLYLRPAPVSVLEGLTHHADADVRVLALLGMVAQETREVVPACLRLMNDKTPTLPKYSGPRNHIGPSGRLPFAREVLIQPLTVAEVAREILKRVDCGIFRSRGATEAEAIEWWAARNGNSDWLAWYDFLYTRAHRGTNSPPEDTKDAVLRFRTNIDALPTVTRAWVLLYLADDVFMNSGRWENHLATELEMIDAVTSLGADVLIEFLRSGKRLGLREPSLDDRGKGRRFIITYASRFFTQEHADELLKLKLFTAAADADPSRVRDVAKLGMKAFAGVYDNWERAKVMAALAALGNSEDRLTAVKWFYDEPNKKGGSSSQSILIHELEQRRPSTWRDIVREIVIQPAFERLQVIDVMYLAMAVERFDGTRKFIFPGYRYEDHGDATRQELREMFEVGR